MSTTIATPPTTATAASSANHTLSVGIEPMPPPYRGLDAATWNARNAVILRTADGQLAGLLTHDHDPGLPGGLAALIAETLTYAAIAAAPIRDTRWSSCSWCGQPDITCPDLFGHTRLTSGTETGWR